MVVPPGVFRPSTLRYFLDTIGKRASKHLSQNFLIDGNILNKLVEVSTVAPRDTIVEIGPGPGALTEALLAKGATVYAIEKDACFAHHLERLQTPDQRLHIRNQDALDIDYSLLLPKSCNRAKVVANLPYHITTPLITCLAPLWPVFHSLTVMVQKEVAERCTAAHGSPHADAISLFLQVYSYPSFCFSVSPSCFYPSPSVHSAVIHLALKAPPSEITTEAFFRFTRFCFHQRRKTIRKTLRSLYSVAAVEHALHVTQCPPSARPDQLSLADFIGLHIALGLPDSTTGDICKHGHTPHAHEDG